MILYLSFDEFCHEILVESPAVVDGDQEEDEAARHAQEQQHGPGHHARALQGGLLTRAGNEPLQSFTVPGEGLYKGFHKNL